MTELPRAGIIIPSKNRSDFVIRQIRYYASVKCPHTIYIGDSSDEEHRKKIEKEIGILKNKIKIIYSHLPSSNNGQAIYHLLSITKEPYACFSGDDDYQIPDSITRCIEFLEKNRDYATASGYSVSFRLKNNGVYGELNRIANYPRRAIELGTAKARIVDFFENYYVPLFSVNRTGQMLNDWKNVDQIDDEPFAAEITPSALSIIDGKSAIIDCLGFIRQIHDKHFKMPTTFDWITSDKWKNSYDKFSEILSSAISPIDHIPAEEARNSIKQALQIYLIKQLSHEYSQIYLSKNELSPKTTGLKQLKSSISRNFPQIKRVYKKWIKKTNIKDLHFDVTQKSSKYYKDFKPVVDSFTGDYSG